MTEQKIAQIFEQVGLAKIVRELANDELMNAVQSAMIAIAQEQPSLPEGLDKCPEYCFRSNCWGCPIYEKHKELLSEIHEGLEEAAEEYKNNHPTRAYWLEGEFIEETTPLNIAFKAGAEWMAKQMPHWTNDPDFHYGMVSTTCIKDGIVVLAHNGKTIPLSELENLPIR